MPAWMSTWNAMATLLRSNWHLTIVLVVFASTMLVIPVLADAPSTDDWAYSRSVEVLIHEGRLHILDLTVVTLLFQVAWGALFSLFFGVGFGAMRLSTVVLVGISIPAMYDICRSVGARRSLAACGAALYVFNPLTFSLAFTFMSDPQFTALMVISTSLYLRGLRSGQSSQAWFVAGSAAAACALLVRQQGVLIPIGVLVYFYASRQWTFSRQHLRTTVATAGIPVATGLVYLLWSQVLAETPEQQGVFIDQIFNTKWSGTRLLTERLTFIEAMYIGACVVPLTLSLTGALPSWRPARNWVSTVLVAAWGLMLLFGATVFFDQGRVMPYIQQFVGAHGVGPTDLVGGRPSLVSHAWLIAITWLCVASAMVFGLFTANAVAAPRSRERSAAGMVMAIGGFQVFGILPPSFHFADWIISVDRYLLPLVPVAIALLLWAIRDFTINTVRLWVLTGLLAAFSIVATRDCLVFQEETWASARRGISYGVPLTMLDAGASWDGYHLYEFSETNGITQQTPGGPWWTNLFGPATNSTYVVTSIPLPGFVIVESREYSSWLDPNPTFLYLLRRDWYPGPP